MQAYDEGDVKQRLSQLEQRYAEEVSTQAQVRHRLYSVAHAVSYCDCARLAGAAVRVHAVHAGSAALD